MVERLAAMKKCTGDDDDRDLLVSLGWGRVVAGVVGESEHTHPFPRTI